MLLIIAALLAAHLLLGVATVLLLLAIKGPPPSEAPVTIIVVVIIFGCVGFLTVSLLAIKEYSPMLKGIPSQIAKPFLYYLTFKWLENK